MLRKDLYDKANMRSYSGFMSSLLNLESLVDRPWIMIMCFKTATERRISIHSLGESAYAFDCTFIKLIFLTVKTLRRITMHSFPVGATEPKKTYTQTRPNADSRFK